MKNEIKEIASYPKLLFSAIIKIFSKPKLLAYVSIPYLIAILIFISFFSFAYNQMDAIIAIFTSSSGGFLYYLCWLFSFILICIATSLFSILGLIVLGGVFIDLMLEKLLIEKKLLEDKEIKIKEFIKQSLKSILADLLITIIMLLCALITFIVAFFPPLALLPILLAAFSLGWGLLDRPMALMLWTTKARLKFIKQHKIRTLSLGLFFTILFCLPLASIFLLPPALVMSIEILDKEIVR